jgi:hypothetical protein
MGGRSEALSVNEAERVSVRRKHTRKKKNVRRKQGGPQTAIEPEAGAHCICKSGGRTVRRV